MSTLKTLPNDADVLAFINAVLSESKRIDSLKLLSIFTEITDEKPMMWGASMVGFGSYHYSSDRSKQEGDWPLIAFSPRSRSLTLYIMDGFDHYRGLLSKLGKYKTSVSCLYINKLTDVDEAVLRELIQKSYQSMKVNHIHSQ